MEEIDEGEILSLLQKRCTYKDISKILKERYPGTKGLSEMSVRRYMERRNLSTIVSKEHVFATVSSAVAQVCIFC